MTNKEVDVINISINFDIILETSYYCKLYVYDMFDRIITQTIMNL